MTINPGQRSGLDDGEYLLICYAKWHGCLFVVITEKTSTLRSSPGVAYGSSQKFGIGTPKGRVVRKHGNADGEGLRVIIHVNKNSRGPITELGLVAGRPCVCSLRRFGRLGNRVGF